MQDAFGRSMHSQTQPSAVYLPERPLIPRLASLLASRLFPLSEPCYSGRHQDFPEAVTFRANPATYAALTLTHDTCSVGVQHTSHLLASAMYPQYATWKGIPTDRREVGGLTDKPIPAAQAREYRQHQLRTHHQNPLVRNLCDPIVDPVMNGV